MSDVGSRCGSCELRVEGIDLMLVRNAALEQFRRMPGRDFSTSVLFHYNVALKRR